MTTDLSKIQLVTILSALDGERRNPATRDAASRAISRSAERLGLTTDEVLAAAPGLLDGRLGPAAWRAELQDLAPTTGSAGDALPQSETPAPAADEAATAPQDGEEGGAPAPEAPEAAEPAPAAAETAPAAAAPDAAPVTRPTPRAGTKQALLIEMLERPEGATALQIAAATGWQHHTVRGAIAGALDEEARPHHRGHPHPRGRFQSARRQGQHRLPDHRAEPGDRAGLIRHAPQCLRRRRSLAPAALNPAPPN